LWEAKEELLADAMWNTSALFTSTVVRNINTSRTAAMVLCLAGSSGIVFEAAHFEGNAVRPITVLSPIVKLHVKGSNFTNNKLRKSPSRKNVDGGVLLIGGGTVFVESSTFSNNTVVSNGAAIAMEGSASLQLAKSTFTGNKGESCMPSIRAHHDHRLCMHGWLCAMFVNCLCNIYSWNLVKPVGQFYASEKHPLWSTC
jgi:parallel beta-helix repeat protein